MDIILTNTVSRYRFRESYNYVLIWFENFENFENFSSELPVNENALQHVVYKANTK